MNRSAAGSRGGLFAARTWALVALAGMGGYVVIDAALAVIDPWYSLIRNTESDYGVGAHAWLMDVNFLIRGGFSLAAAAAIAAIVPVSKPRNAAIAAIVIWAVASAALAFFPDRPISTGQIHLALAGVAFTAVAVGTVVLSRSLTSVAGLRRYVVPLTIISVLGVIAWIVTVAFARSPVAWFGLVERIFLALEILWIGIVMGALVARRPGPTSGPGSRADQLAGERRKVGIRLAPEVQGDDGPAPSVSGYERL